jgi:acetolactate synthase-1/3 small subunit
MTQNQTTESHTIAVLVDNEAGVLGRVIGLFSGRGYNIESLTVSEVDHHERLSRINIVTPGHADGDRTDQAQLGPLVPVHRVRDLTADGPSCSGNWRWSRWSPPATAASNPCASPNLPRRVVDSTNESFVFEIVGKTGKLDAFIRLMEPWG